MALVDQSLWGHCHIIVIKLVSGAGVQFYIVRLKATVLKHIL